ncbi:bacterioferritin-associated ferredoxin, partial [Marinibaculum pumilum]
LARCRRGWRLELAGDGPAGDPAAIAAAVLGGIGDGEQVYADAASGSYRLARFAGDRLVAALYLAPGPVAVSRAWLADLLGREMPSPQDRMALLAGRPGGDRPDPGATVCACFAVGANTILQAVGRGCATVDAIGASLGAGSNCGSCRAEIGELIRHAGR